MLWLLGGLCVSLLGTGVALAIWVSKLKDGQQTWMQKHANISSQLQDAQLKLVSVKGQRDRFSGQLVALRGDFDDLATRVSDGSLCSGSDIASELTKLLSRRPETPNS